MVCGDDYLSMSPASLCLSAIHWVTEVRTYVNYVPRCFLLGLWLHFVYICSTCLIICWFCCFPMYVYHFLMPIFLRIQGTIAKGAALLHQEGAREVYACSIHAVFRYHILLIPFLQPFQCMIRLFWFMWWWQSQDLGMDKCLENMELGRNQKLFHQPFSLCKFMALHILA